jgi:hypothetical protein
MEWCKKTAPAAQSAGPLREGSIGRNSPDKPAEAQVWRAAKASRKTAYTLD